MSTCENELLGIEIDKSGNKILVYFATNENMSIDLTVFFMHQWANLIKNCHVNKSYIPSITGARAIFAVHNDKIVGIRVWRWELNQARIILSAVDEDYRKLGILTLMNKFYEQRILGANCTQSNTFIHKDNKPMLAAAEKLGYTVDIIKMTKKF